MGSVYSGCDVMHNTKGFAVLVNLYLFIEDTEGTFSWVQTPSANSRSRISQANIVGFSRLYFAMASTTIGVATLGFDPPITPAL